MNINGVTSNNKNYNNDFFKDNEFKHQINLAINESKKLIFY